MPELAGGPLDSIPEGGARLVARDELRIAVFKVEGRPYAIDAVCPHKGGPLEEGEVQSFVLACPLHGFRFDLRTGANPFNRACTARIYPVRIERGEVVVTVP